VIAPPTVNYELPERAQVAQLFSQAADVLTREALYPLCMSLLKAMAQLCRRRESPCRPHMRRSRKTVAPKFGAVVYLQTPNITMTGVICNAPPSPSPLNNQQVWSIYVINAKSEATPERNMFHGTETR